ncbi:hypothetical protein Q8A67_018124 [Cirrhinus molitorella]|uniref:Uncharacterized protein n=1 Tax=Cirrhinus molitorella TaxID=172907 RepID=A0AA88TEF0_9TELE|nr:hypothetical protein Q8A67_018124 [Cirrhinus molitorella]
MNAATSMRSWPGGTVQCINGGVERRRETSPPPPPPPPPPSPPRLEHGTEGSKRGLRPIRMRACHSLRKGEEQEDFEGPEPGAERAVRPLLESPRLESGSGMRQIRRDAE